MKLVTAVLCLALGTAGATPARADEVGPSFDGIERGADAAETYRLNALGIVHEEMSGWFFVGRGSWWRPVRGKFRWATSYDDFYLKVGRDDLGERDRHRRVVSTTLNWGGTLVMLGGVVVLVTEVVRGYSTRFEIGGGMVVGGFVIGSVGSMIQPPLVKEADAAAMANAYNRRLQVHLGLTPMGANTGRDRLPIGFALSRRW